MLEAFIVSFSTCKLFSVSQMLFLWQLDFFRIFLSIEASFIHQIISSIGIGMLLSHFFYTCHTFRNNQKLWESFLIKNNGQIAQESHTLNLTDSVFQLETNFSDFSPLKLFKKHSASPLNLPSDLLIIDLFTHIRTFTQKLTFSHQLVHTSYTITVLSFM